MVFASQAKDRLLDNPPNLLRYAGEGQEGLQFTEMHVSSCRNKSLSPRMKRPAASGAVRPSISIPWKLVCVQQAGRYIPTPGRRTRANFALIFPRNSVVNSTASGEFGGRSNVPGTPSFNT